jgi:ankyrin repeat protein
MGNQNNKSLLHVAVRNKDMKQIKLLINKGFDINKELPIPFLEGGLTKNETLYPLCIAIRTKNTDLIKRLIEYGAVIKSHSHEKGELQWQCLEDLMKIVSQSDDSKLMNFLLSHGFNPNMLFETSDHGKGGVMRSEKYPLNVASEFCSVQVAKLLIKSGANINQEHVFSNRYNTLFTTSLYIALISKSNNSYEMVNLLLENKADSNKGQRDIYHATRSPLNYAFNAGDIKKVYLLISYRAEINFEYFKNKLDQTSFKDRQSLNYNINHMESVLKKEFTTNTIIYYPKRRSLSIAYSFFCLKVKYSNLKKDLLLYLITFMI